MSSSITAVLLHCGLQRKFQNRNAKRYATVVVVLTGFERNMNHIILGTDNQHPLGMIFGFVGLAVVLGLVGCGPLHFLECSAPTATSPQSDVAIASISHSDTSTRFFTRPPTLSF